MAKNDATVAPETPEERRARDVLAAQDRETVKSMVKLIPDMTEAQLKKCIARCGGSTKGCKPGAAALRKRATKVLTKVCELESYDKLCDIRLGLQKVLRPPPPAQEGRYDTSKEKFEKRHSAEVSGTGNRALDHLERGQYDKLEDLHAVLQGDPGWSAFTRFSDVMRTAYEKLESDPGAETVRSLLYRADAAVACFKGDRPGPRKTLHSLLASFRTIVLMFYGDALLRGSDERLEKLEATHAISKRGDDTFARAMGALFLANELHIFRRDYGRCVPLYREASACLAVYNAGGATQVLALTKIMVDIQLQTSLTQSDQWAPAAKVISGCVAAVESLLGLDGEYAAIPADAPERLVLFLANALTNLERNREPEVDRPRAWRKLLAVARHLGEASEAEQIEVKLRHEANCAREVDAMKAKLRANAAAVNQNDDSPFGESFLLAAPVEADDEDVACAACKEEVRDRTWTCAKCELVVYCDATCRKTHAKEHRLKCKGPAQWLDMDNRVLSAEARDARRCVVCDDAGDVVVTVESVGRRRGADVFFWDADDPPRERDREFFPCRWRLCASPACLGTEYAASGRLATKARTLHGLALRHRFSTRKFRDGTGAVAQIRASDHFHDAMIRRDRNAADNGYTLVARSKDDLGLQGGLNSVPSDPAARARLGIELPARLEKKVCHFCGTILMQSKTLRCCGDVRYCGAYCQTLSWPEHRIVCAHANPN
ncbi:hypothetical protein SO694_0002233 [Aureococcus anophagefferens]|uniref:MYND-type domain-containing protein n=1 Tax=Aureococcus anophagefferens TaxID=44056 RepID=A0ABR1FT72_AURAN